jgi:predicted nucleic acid-binding protein
MADGAFFDSNVLLYLLSADRAQALHDAGIGLCSRLAGLR